jgi:hypothetical protein
MGKENPLKRTPLLLSTASLLGVLAALPAAAQELHRFTVPHRGWTVSFALAPLVRYEAAASAGGNFQLQGQTDEGTSLSFFVEPSSAGADSESCRSRYWADASRNPMINRSTVSLVTINGMPAVQYVFEGKYQGQQVKMQHLNVYAAHQGTCIDFHVSRFPFAEGDLERLRQVAGTLAVGP